VVEGAGARFVAPIVDGFLECGNGKSVDDRVTGKPSIAGEFGLILSGLTTPSSSSSSRRRCVCQLGSKTQP
jgi:hypothetical protein